MDYFLSIYNIYNWIDYNIKLLDVNTISSHTHLIILSILLKKHPKEIIITNGLLSYVNQLFVKYKLLKEPNIQTTNDLLLKLNNSKELLFTTIDNFN